MWTKICGVTSLDQALQIAALAPDALGLNFYPPSPRSVTPRVAREIISQLPSSVRPVGVFVNHSVDEIREICHSTGLRTVQLHGDEPIETAAQLQEFDLIRVFRITGQDFSGVAAALAEYAARQIPLLACLVDAKVDGAYGGTGHLAPWQALAEHWDPEWPPLILAGGLTPENVADGIETVRPFGVDTASGVEDRPGQKNLDAVRQFLTRARQTTENHAT
ncbi:phosphoribosylanthranilate isomerase [Planctomicrobium sp. SH664]|uniref:phosphoribosylanthranilate isomerase n=1 Tax=Planctomicrobium sp. SH664 TaxID=3448125 RepID=UPI003F5B645C